jgi:cell division protein FtsB
MPKKRSSFKNIIFSQKFLAFLGLLILTLISVPLGASISKRNKISQEIKELEKEISQIENKNKDLNKLISYLESSQFIEEQARLKFGLKKPGEEVVIIKEDYNNIRQNKESNIFKIPGLENAKPEKQLANPERWWRYFFK